VTRTGTRLDFFISNYSQLFSFQQTEERYHLQLFFTSVLLSFD
jgi:hypothetical protein